MFGHQNNQDENQPTDNNPSDIPPADNSLSDSSTATVVDPPGAPAAPSDDWPEPTVRHGQMLPPVQASSNNDDKDDNDAPSSEPAPASTPSVPPTDESNGDGGDLLEIKQHALQQLSPLVSHLNQSPEEKFRTLMMMIQASDNQSLINSAYEAANAITDEKVKAQALLDVINEINYFTHPHEN